MAKNNFLMSDKWKEMFTMLPDEKAGQLIKAAFLFHTGEEYAIDDPVLLAVFAVIKNEIEENDKRYDEQCERNKINGSKGGRPKKQSDNEKPTETERFLEKPKKPDNDSDSDNDNDLKEKDSLTRVQKETPARQKQKKHVYGEYQNVKLTDDEYEKLIDEYGFNKTEAAIKKLDEYIEETGKKYQSHYLVLKRWVFDAIEERNAPPGNQGGWSQRQPTRNEKWRTAGGHNSAENDALKMAVIAQSRLG